MIFPKILLTIWIKSWFQAFGNDYDKDDVVSGMHYDTFNLNVNDAFPISQFD